MCVLKQTKKCVCTYECSQIPANITTLGEVLRFPFYRHNKFRLFRTFAHRNFPVLYRKSFQLRLGSLEKTKKCVYLNKLRNVCTYECSQIHYKSFMTSRNKSRVYRQTLGRICLLPYFNVLTLV